MSIFADFRFAARTLRAKPLFTGIAVASLALGIGANTAIFSVVDSALLRQLPYDQANRLILVRDHQPLFADASLAPGEFLDYQRESKTLSGLATYTGQQLTLTGSGEPQRLHAAAVTTNFFEVLGAHAELGRLFQSSLDKPGEDRAVVLSDATWRGVFGSNANIVGQTIRLNGNPFHVAGVLRGKENFPTEAQVWITPRFAVPEHVEDQHKAGASIAGIYGNHWLIGIGRMGPAVTLGETRAELNLIAKRIAAAHPNTRDHHASMVPLHETLVADVEPALWVMLGAVVLLLLIACSNSAGLLLARSAGRTRELAVRAALGATRIQIIRLLLAESLLLAVAGGAVGIFLASQAQQWIAKNSPYDLPASLAPQMNWQILAFCITVTLLSALFSGLVPALRSAQTDVQDSLKEGVKGSASGGSNRLRRLLVSTEIALSVMLLSGASLLIHSFAKLLDVNPGFTSANVLTARVSLPLSRYSHDAANIFWRKLVENVSALPDVQSAAIVTDLPMSGGESGSEINAVGIKQTVYSDEVGISAGFFEAMRIPMLSGRTFDGSETENSPLLVVVNRSFAEKVFPNQYPIGRKFEGGPVGSPTTIIGVVADVHNNGLSETAPLVMYYSYPQYGVDSASIVVHTRGASRQCSDRVTECIALARFCPSS